MMTDLREAAEMALEALDQATGMCAERTSTRRDIDEAMAALRQALEQREQEPVAFVCRGKLSTIGHCEECKPLYTAPPKREFIGLTDKEIAEGAKQSWVEKQAFESAVWWAESKLREKNGF